MFILLTMKVRQVCHIALKRDHEFIDTVRGDSEETHSQVCSVDLYFSYTILITTRHIFNLMNS